MCDAAPSGSPCDARRAAQADPPLRRGPLLAALTGGVVAVVLAVHWPALSARAICFDDDQYLLANPLVRNPSAESAWRFLTEVRRPSTVKGYYQPLAMISLMLDTAMGGRPDDIRPYHRTSLALHAANTVLVIVLVYMLFGQPWIAAMVGLLFGLHPLTVEPIAWVGERKTMLASFFALGCVNVYVRYARRGGWARYAGCAALYVLALLAKPTSTPLPVLLVLLDFWPLGRLTRRSLVEKIPLFVIGGASAIVTMISQSQFAPMPVPGDYPALRVPLILCHNIVFYLFKIVWPVDLSVHYAYPKLALSDPMVLAGVVGTCALVPALVISLRWTRALLTGCLIFFVVALPTMGLVGFTIVLTSDKYAYLPSVGLLLAAAWALCRAEGGVVPIGRPTPRQIGVLAVVLALAGLEARATRHTLAKWSDTEGLYRHTIELDPGALRAYNNLALTLADKGRLDEAIDTYRQALRVDPKYPLAHKNLAATLAQLGRLDQAIAHYTRALELEPDQPAVHYNLANVLARKGDVDGAIAHYEAVLRLQPLPLAHFALGNLLLSNGRFDEAIPHLSEVVRLKPDMAAAHSNLGAALLRTGHVAEAVNHFAEAIRLQPDLLSARKNLASALTHQGKTDQAIDQYRQILRLQPNDPDARRKLGALLGQ